MESHVQRIQFDKLGEAVGVSGKWWRRRLPQLKAAGLVTRRGKYWFGSPSALIAWVGADQGVVHASRGHEIDRARVLVEGVAEETRDPDLVAAAAILRTC
jgi:DNA-binding Lrp family transcriptional regulator